MQLRTATNITEYALPTLKHDGCVMLLGSCFSDNMGQRLRGAMIDAVVNPFGTTYNPLSLLECIKWLQTGRRAVADELFMHGGLWHHFMFHSRYSNVDVESTLHAINESIGRGREQLSRCSHLFVTLGTAFVYRLNGSVASVVNNCHKLPAARFTRSMCSLDEISLALGELADVVHDFNASSHIIFTVSPIRHLADGMAMNHLSKSILTVAVHDTIATHRNFCHYFPAYEIMNDDLRDYRFYAADMAHPSDVAIDYIWEQFKMAFFTSAERQKVEECERMSKLLAHCPTSRNSEAVEQFKQKIRQALADIAIRFPHIKNLDYIKNYMI